MRGHAEQIDLIPQEGAAAVRFTADGVSYSGTSMGREEAASAVVYLKKMAGLDLNQMRKPQTGKTKITYGGEKKEKEKNTPRSTPGGTGSVWIPVEVGGKP